MEEVDTGHHLEQLAGEMLRGPVAGRAVVDLARICFRVGDEFGNRLRRKRRTYRHDVGKSNDAGNRREVADEIEAEFFVERRIDRVHRAAQQQCVTVRGCTNDRFGRYIAARAGPVLDDDRLAGAAPTTIGRSAAQRCRSYRRPRSRRGCAPAASDRLAPRAKRDATGSAAAPAARCRNRRRGSFISPSQRHRAIRAWTLHMLNDETVMPADGAGLPVHWVRFLDLLHDWPLPAESNPCRPKARPCRLPDRNKSCSSRPDTLPTRAGPSAACFSRLAESFDTSRL